MTDRRPEMRDALRSLPVVVHSVWANPHICLTVSRSSGDLLVTLTPVADGFRSWQDGETRTVAGVVDLVRGLLR
jgi:hypothetical protein